MRALLEDFAKCFSLQPDLCTAWHFKTGLEGDEVLSKVAADGRTLALCFDFTPSIALYIWQSFSKQWPAVQHSDDVLDVWMYASETLYREFQLTGCFVTTLAALQTS